MDKNFSDPTFLGKDTGNKTHRVYRVAQKMPPLNCPSPRKLGTFSSPMIVFNNTGTRDLMKTTYDVVNPSKVMMLQQPTNLAILDPQATLAKSSYLLDPICSAHLTSSMAQK